MDKLKLNKIFEYSPENIYIIPKDILEKKKGDVNLS